MTITSANLNPAGKQAKSIGVAMILAAGIGSRLKPWTDKHPKALAVVNGKSLLQRNVEYLQQFGIWDVVVNVHHFADQIVKAIQINNGWGSRITISDETEELLETGGGLLKAAPLFANRNPIVLLNADILTDMNLEAMIGYHQEKKPLATLATTQRQTSRHFLFDEGNNLVGWQNTTTGQQKLIDNKIQFTPKAFSGIHIIESKIFNLIAQKGRFSMVDVYLHLMHNHTIKSFDHSEGRIIDVGKPGSLEQAALMFANNHNN